MPGEPSRSISATIWICCPIASARVSAIRCRCVGMSLSPRRMEGRRSLVTHSWKGAAEGFFDLMIKV